jgi:hypothetical protein
MELAYRRAMIFSEANYAILPSSMQIILPFIHDEKK